MKTVSKLLIVGGILLAVGVGVTAIGTVIAYNVREGTAASVRVDKEYTAAEDVSTLRMSLISETIEIEKADVEAVHITYSDKEAEDESLFDFTLTDGVLTMTENRDSWFWFFNWVWPWNYNFNEYIATVTVPLDADIDYRLSTVSGSITATGLASTQGYEANTTSGNVALTSSEFAGAVRLLATSGTITCTDVVSGGNVYSAVVSGNVNLTNVATDFRVEASSTSGTVSCENIVCDSMVASAVSGNITLDYIDAEKSIRAGGVSTNIDLSVPDTIDQYSIDVSTTSGTANVADRSVSSAPKTMKLSTTSGNINVDFGATI